MTRSQIEHERIEQEAADWLAALETGQADLPSFEAWRARDPAHAIAFIRIEQSWRAFDRLRDDRIAAASPQPSVTPEEKRPVLPRRRAIATAAGVLMAASASTGLIIASQAAAHTVETAVGERRRFYVSNRICLDLNTASRLQWWHSDNGIEVHLLRGELSVDLAAGAPLCRLVVGGAQLEVVRGHFVARLRDADAADVVAVSGQARMLPRRGQTQSTLLPERARLQVAAGMTTAQPLTDRQIRAASAWQEGELLFDGEPLSLAIEEFNRYLPTPMIVSDPAISRLRMGGRFLSHDPAEFLKALRVNFGVRAQLEGDRIVLRK